MTTFARVLGGYALDCLTASDASGLAARFHPDWLAAHPFVIVPDGTKHGAADNGDGTFTNPIPVVQPPVDAMLSRADLIAHCVTQFGTNARWGAVILAAKTATDPTVAGLYEQYTALIQCTKAQAQGFFTAIRAASLPNGGVVTVAEITAIVVNWPKVQQ